jgi:hypothetical protein
VFNRNRRNGITPIGVITVIMLLCSYWCKAAAEQVRLTSLKPTSVVQVYGRLEMNDGQAEKSLRIGDKRFNYGITTCANSEVVYALNGKYGRFEVWAGTNADMKGRGTGAAIFYVYADGKEVFNSGIVDYNSPAQQIFADVHDIKELDLIVLNIAEDRFDVGSGTYAIWAQPVLTPVESLRQAKTSEPKYDVQSKDITISLDPSGEITGLKIAEQKKSVNLKGGTRLIQCRSMQPVEIRKLGSGGIEFKHFMADKEGHHCTVTEQFVPTRDSIRWKADIYSEDKPWSTAIVTGLQWPAGKNTRFWTAWSNPDMIGEPWWVPEALKKSWRDPLESRPFTNASRWYGSNFVTPLPTSGDYFSIPLVTVLEPENQIGLSLVQSPEDVLLYMKLITTESGSLEFQRRYYRLGGGSHVNFAMDLVTHPADWRGGLAWMVKRYPQFFEPVSAKAYEMGGCAAYSSWEGELDVKKLKEMGFRVNWKASFDFPYLGMFLPPVDKWQTFATPEEAFQDPWVQGEYKGRPIAMKDLRNYSKQMRQDGFFVLNYFNATEFGTKVKGPEAVHKGVAKQDIWKNSTDFVNTQISDSILHNEKGVLYRSWGGAIVLDCGAKDYQTFLLEQAKRYLDELPESSGICIDRLDWLSLFNAAADDGVTWYDNKPVRSLLISWKNMMDRLGPLMHKHDKVIFVNPITSMRLEVLRQADGIYSEHNEMGPALNASALLGICKPVLTWTWDANSLWPDPDGYFQRQLYLGTFPTAPFPGNNHTIVPSEFADKWYLDYGPLFNELNARKWVLEPDVINVANGSAKANLFEIPDGYVISVMLADKNVSRVKVILNSPARFDTSKVFEAEALHPGIDKKLPVGIVYARGKLVLDVPLGRGCAMVRLSQKKMVDK